MSFSFIFIFNFDFSKIEFNKTEINNIPTQTEEENERDWEDAKRVLVDYFARINFGRYEEATTLRNEKYLEIDVQEYAERLRQFQEEQIVGDINIVNLERVEEESKRIRKVFRFERNYLFALDHKKHGEIQKAYLVFRDGQWLIDVFKVELKF